MNRQTGTRLECLRLAVHHAPPGSLFNIDQVMERADRYFDWVTAEQAGSHPDTHFRTSRKAPAHARKPGR